MGCATAMQDVMLKQWQGQGIDPSQEQNTNPVIRISPPKGDVSMRMMVMVYFWLVFGATQASAGDVEPGARLAQQWCTACHVIGSGTHGQDAAPPLPPPLDRGQDQQWIRVWLANPHPPMPNLNLSRQEIDDIVAYLASLPRK
jgi:mono/diheme cytochrome c family protein